MTEHGPPQGASTLSAEYHRRIRFIRLRRVPPTRCLAGALPNSQLATHPYFPTSFVPNNNDVEPTAPSDWMDGPIPA